MVARVGVQEAVATRVAEAQQNRESHEYVWVIYNRELKRVVGVVGVVGVRGTVGKTGLGGVQKLLAKLTVKKSRRKESCNYRYLE